MSHEGTNWAIKQRGLKPTTKLVLWHLADRHNPDFGCFPRQDRLAEDVEISRSTLNEHLIKLEEEGLIRRVQRIDRETGRQMSTRYILGFEGDFEQHDASPRPDIGLGEASKENPSPRPKTGHGTVSGNEASPCPENDDSRVRNPDTNLVRGTFKRTSKQSVTHASGEPKPVKARLPTNWTLSDDNRRYAEEQGIPERVIKDEAQNFHAYWTDRTDAGAKKSQRGWDQCWNSWCRRIAPRHQTAARRQYAGGGEQFTGLAGAALRRRAERAKGLQT